MLNTTTTSMMLVLACGSGLMAEEPAAAGAGVQNLQLIEGGAFQMGDVFGEGVPLATPVHEVTVSSFYLNRYEVTVAEFTVFVERTGYVTSAERGDDCPAQSGKVPAPRSQAEYDARLASCGAFILDPVAQETSWGLGASWRNPLFEQRLQNPVTCVSWTDAVSYCNWLSAEAGLPAAYDVKTGNLLDAEGRATTDVTKVKGYRLPTEAEWEYAARERGRKVRFGNGQDFARPGEMNFNAAEGEFAFGVRGVCRARTTPVGSFKPNSLGLYDMSGNVWEWCSDVVGRYPAEPQTDPYELKGVMGSRRAARGGPWAGDAGVVRACARFGWVANDRCNNIGFRVARSR